RVAAHLARQPGRPRVHPVGARRRRARHRVAARAPRPARVGHGRAGGRGGAGVLRADGVHRCGRRRRRRDRHQGPRAGRGRRSVSFPLLAPPVLSRSVVMRDEPIRSDRERQLAGWPKARLVVIDEGGRTPVDWGEVRRPRDRWDMISGSGARLITRPTTGDEPPPDAVLLGEHEGVAYWAVRGKADLVAGEDPTDWADLRTVGAALDALGAGLLTGAVALLNW